MLRDGNSLAIPGIFTEDLDTGRLLGRLQIEVVPGSLTQPHVGLSKIELSKYQTNEANGSLKNLELDSSKGTKVTMSSQYSFFRLGSPAYGATTSFLKPGQVLLKLVVHSVEFPNVGGNLQGKGVDSFRVFGKLPECGVVHVEKALNASLT